MTLRFEKLNKGWNADPNAPRPIVEREGAQLRLKFRLNTFQFPECGDSAVLSFENCSRYRLGGPNDEGWYLGQCRYGRLAPEWGEFYELIGDDPLLGAAGDWRLIEDETRPQRHFLFYLRDETFECLAADCCFTAESSDRGND